MYDIQEKIIQLTKQAKELHENEKKMQIRSCALIEELEYLNASVNLGYTKESFAELIGLSIDVYWKRAQIGRILARFPEVVKMIYAGELRLSHVNIFAAKITEANTDILLKKIKGKTTRQIQFEVSTITLDGDVIEREPEVELRLTLKKSDMDKLQRAIKVLSSAEKTATKSEVLSASLNLLLDKNDPTSNPQKRTTTPDGHQETTWNQNPLTPPDRQKSSASPSPNLACPTCCQMNGHLSSPPKVPK